MDSQRFTVFPLGVLFDKSVVAGLLDLLRDFAQRTFPGNIFPMVGTGAPYLRLYYSPFIQNILLEGSALGAKRAAIYRVIGVAFDMDYLRRYIFCAVADGVNDYAATDRAIGASRAGLAGSGNLQIAKLRVRGLQVEAKNGCGNSTNGCKFQEVTAGMAARGDSSAVADN